MTSGTQRARFTTSLQLTRDVMLKPHGHDRPLTLAKLSPESPHKQPKRSGYYSKNTDNHGADSSNYCDYSVQRLHGP